MRLKTPIMRLDLRDYSDMYIVVKDRTTIEGGNLINRRYEKLTFKNISPFRSCISKINNTFVDSEKDLDIAMPMFNLLEYSENYSVRSRIL